jgi:cellulose synthase/poly-beta-1,6-N-acetylglucosamine synthase-like glycosyltransferase
MAGQITYEPNTNSILHDITVAMPTFDDDPVVLGYALDAALAQGLVHPITIVDMSRGDEVAAAARARGKGVRVIPCPDSRGVSDSRNRLVALVETRYLLFLDADAVPTPGWAEAMRRRFDEDERAAVVGARCLPHWPDSPPLLFETAPASDFLSFFDLGPNPIEVPRIMGTSYALDLERLPPQPFPLEVGRSPESPLAGEEVELCLAAQRSGWSVVYEPSAVVYHHVRPNRASWRWMWRRVFVAGQESRRLGRRLEPLPRRTPGVLDVIFMALVAPAFLYGKLRRPPVRQI